MKTKKDFFSEKLDLNFSIQTPRPGAHHLGSCQGLLRDHVRGTDRKRVSRLCASQPAMMRGPQVEKITASCRRYEEDNILTKEMEVKSW